MCSSSATLMSTTTSPFCCRSRAVGVNPRKKRRATVLSAWISARNRWIPALRALCARASAEARHSTASPPTAAHEYCGQSGTAAAVGGYALAGAAGWGAVAAGGAAAYVYEGATAGWGGAEAGGRGLALGQEDSQGQAGRGE